MTLVEVINETTGHIQVPIETPHGVFYVDSNISEMLIKMNQFPGVTTEWSCEGEGQFGGYVCFYGEGAITFVGKLLHQLSRVKHNSELGTSINVKVQSAKDARLPESSGVDYRLALRWPTQDLGIISAAVANI